MSKLDKPLTTEEQIKVLKSGERVMALSQKIFDMLVSETDGLPGHERWMVISRSISGVFAHHFSICLSTAGAEMSKRAQKVEPESHAPPSVL
jgi:hypothetical protein